MKEVLSGSWGYTPYENDSAMDLLSKYQEIVLNSIKQEIKNWKLGESKDLPYQHIICTAQYLLDYCNNFEYIEGEDEFYVVIKALRIALEIAASDSEYINSWSEPKSCIKMIKNLIKDITVLENREKDKNKQK